MYIVNNEKNSSILLEWEEGIFKEFSFVPYSVYKTERIKFLNTWIDKKRQPTIPQKLCEK
jgi:hypothetical protein